MRRTRVPMRRTRVPMRRTRLERYTRHRPKTQKPQAATDDEPDPLRSSVAAERSFGLHLQKIITDRPTADVTLDQAKATAETLARRAAYMDRNGLVGGRRILFLGDDDFTSQAVAEWCVWQRDYGVNVRTKTIVAADIDTRILKTLNAAGRHIETSEYDARNPLHDNLRGEFDVVVTDPPYTVAGAELFLSRAMQAVGAKAGAHCVFCFGHCDPDTIREVQSVISEMGWVITEWLPGFNTYEGAGVLGGVSLLAHLISVKNARPVIEGRYEGPLYTADARPVTRIYQCTSCRTRWEVGPDERWATISELKRAKCPECGADRFRRASQKPAKQRSNSEK